MSICKICGGEYVSLGNHLRSHQIDKMDYWVQYESIDHKYPTCKNCGEPIYSFLNGSLAQGPSKYCCKQCMDEDLPNVLRERHANGIYEGTSYLINEWNYNINLRLDSIARTCYHRILRDVDPYIEGYFYVVQLEDDSIKFGATRQDLKQYIPFRYHYFDYELIRSYSGTLLSVAGIEYLIKISKRFKDYFQEGYVSTTEEMTVDCIEPLTKFLDGITRLRKLN